MKKNYFIIIIFFFFLLPWELGGGYRNTTIVQLEDSMGDFLSPKKKDVFDRLWWRIELYGRHQQKGNKKGKKNFSFFFLLLLWELGGGYRNTTIVQLEDSMGDFLSPKKKDVFDRLWWRIELYGRHQQKGNKKGKKIFLFFFTTLGAWWGLSQHHHSAVRG